MTQEEQSQFEDVVRLLTEAKDKIESLFNSASLPRDVENAFRERLGLSTVVSSLGTTGSATTQNVSVPSVPISIIVPAQPSGTIAVSIKGTTYNLLYK